MHGGVGGGGRKADPYPDWWPLLEPRGGREFLDSRFLQDFSPVSVGLLLGSVLSLAGGRGNRLCFFRIVFASGALQKNN
jgi:hypothetical protein